jgi:hypothetical protein
MGVAVAEAATVAWAVPVACGVLDTIVVRVAEAVKEAAGMLVEVLVAVPIDVLMAVAVAEAAAVAVAVAVVAEWQLFSSTDTLLEPAFAVAISSPPSPL